MKVLHVYRTYFPDPPGGLQEAIRQIALATREVGVESRIFALSPQPSPRQVHFSEGDVVRSKSWGAPASCDLGGWDAWRRFRSLSRWADVVHFHFPWPFGDLLRILGNETAPAVMTYHSDIVRQRQLGELYRPLMNRMLRSMSAIVATSPAYIDSSPVLSVLERPERLHVIPLGITDHADDGAATGAIPRPARLGLNDTEPFLLSLGVLRYYKGLHTLVDAAPAIRSRIVIAGSGPEMDRLRAQASAVGASNIIFAGQVSHEEKIALLKHCTGLLLPSHLRSEAFGMVLVEAAMFGKPMVCCEIGSGTSFVNQHGVTGFVVPPEAPGPFAEAANALLADSALARSMGLAARARYEQLFSGPALGRAYRAIYEQIQ
ncbi:MAG: glycosyltransferase [Janthinobacterium lividum]